MGTVIDTAEASAVLTDAAGDVTGPPLLRASDGSYPARRDAGLSHDKVSVRHFEQGGMRTAVESEAFLCGVLRPNLHDQDIVAGTRPSPRLRPSHA
jgi:hypothetical protein